MSGKKSPDTKSFWVRPHTVRLSRRTLGRFAAIVLVTIFAYNLSPWNGDLASRSGTIMLVALAIVVVVPRTIWKWSGPDRVRARIAQLHGGQLSMLAGASLLISWFLVRAIPTRDDFPSAIWFGLLVASVSAPPILAWRWFDSRK